MAETVQNQPVHDGVLIGADCLQALEATELIKNESVDGNNNTTKFCFITIL